MEAVGNRPRTALALVVTSTVLGLRGTDLVSPAVPSLPETLGGGPAEAQLVLAATWAAPASVSSCSTALSGDPRERAFNRAFKLRRKFGSEDGIGQSIEKPKGMRWRTFERRLQGSWKPKGN